MITKTILNNFSNEENKTFVYDINDGLFKIESTKNLIDDIKENRKEFDELLKYIIEKIELKQKMKLSVDDIKLIVNDLIDLNSDKFSFNIIINKSISPFITSKKGYFTKVTNNTELIYYPLTPLYALEIYKDKYVIPKLKCVLDAYVIEFNKNMFYSELVNSKNYVISNTNNLIDLIKF